MIRNRNPVLEELQKLNRRLDGIEKRLTKVESTAHVQVSEDSLRRRLTILDQGSIRNRRLC